ncbi:hypothetical protein F2P56_003758 [Juglans regia]|uniref:Protein kinase domain-containing protein n=2 Tax=Juglans regia TaxID=51240 RepID=A0A833Y6W9_JUGRE|nr:protein IMPAIRED IN BABA-INDUCED STERILITY 1-like isoform X2 [Juglans regia]KAF5477079.1 hypothetical protein F2P56_003758 [Juglans regia]
MGCVSSKQAVSVTPALDHSGAFRDSGVGAGNSGRIRVGSGENEKGKSSNRKKSGESVVVVGLSGSELGESGRASSNGNDSSLSFRLGNLQKYVEGEQVAAGWPAWLSAVAGEAIQGWIPLRADAFEKLEKIKCYVKQLLSGIEHCHSRGVMHRDIKGSNLLVNNDGILKVADFGLANFYSSGHRQPLTSRVVTLWYRPPELLLGSTDYGASVDLWSVGCVFAELILGKPILQGRTEVEQLHKIFKLCGSPPDDYWKRTKLPHATLFKPQQPYDSSLRETFKNLPKTTISLLETLLSVEPYKRGTAFSALASEYFTSKPYACDPSSLPIYPPSKEIDAKSREEAKRKKIGGRVRGPEITRKPARKPYGICKLAAGEEMANQTQDSHKIKVSNGDILKDVNSTIEGMARKPSVDNIEEASHVKNASQGDVPFSIPLQVSTSSGFAWAKRRKEDASVRSHSRSTSRGHICSIVESTTALHARNNVDSRRHENGDAYGTRSYCRGHDSYEIVKLAMQNNWCKFERPDSFDASDEYHSQELSLAQYEREMSAKRSNLGYQDQGDKVEFSGPLLSQSHRVDELLEKHERHIRRTVRKSWFQRGKRHGK